jgi:glycosyltransferase involved in cell wall biosynthesis
MREPARAPIEILELELVGRGGLAHYTFNLARALEARGHRVTVVTAAGYELGRRAREGGSPRVLETVARAGHRLAGKLPRFLHALVRKVEAIVDSFRVARLVGRQRPDVVHLHSTNPIALLYAFLLGRRPWSFVATAHVVTPHEPGPGQRMVWGGFYRRAHMVIAHSEFDRRRLVTELGVEPDRTAVIPHGEYGFFDSADGGSPDHIAARSGLGLREDHRVALFFGYVREYKGLDVLLDAWPAVTAEVPEARLLLAGDPVRLSRQRREELERQAENVGALHRFAYVPFAEVYRYFAAADALVLPYRRISQSGVLYLALAVGVPVIATAVGGLPEMLTDGESALLVPPESPEELARALRRLLGDDGLRARLAEGGRAIAHRHSWPAVARQTERALRPLEGAQRGSS